jgi:hypothetical protein
MNKVQKTVIPTVIHHLQNPSEPTAKRDFIQANTINPTSAELEVERHPKFTFYIPDSLCHVIFSDTSLSRFPFSFITCKQVIMHVSWNRNNIPQYQNNKWYCKTVPIAPNHSSATPFTNFTKKTRKSQGLDEAKKVNWEKRESNTFHGLDCNRLHPVAAPGCRYFRDKQPYLTR